MNVFDKDLGVHQGRIAAGASDGSFVYELGHALLADLNVGDGDLHEVSQALVLDTGSRMLLTHVRIVTPQELPVGSAWQFSVWLNDRRMVTRPIYPAKRVIILEDMRVSLREALIAPATNTLLFRLELVTT